MECNSKRNISFSWPSIQIYFLWESQGDISYYIFWKDDDHRRSFNSGVTRLQNQVLTYMLYSCAIF
jgi:hypothetical protein